MDPAYRVSAELPAEYAQDYRQLLFQQPAHLALQASKWQHFYLLHDASRRAVAHVAFHFHDGTALTPVAAPFGTLSHADHLRARLWHDFLQEVLAALVQKKISKVRITDAPDFYRAQPGLTQSILFDLGFTIARSEPACVLSLQHDFSEGLDEWERRKLRQSREEGCVFLSPAREPLEEVYDFIFRCRKAKAQPLSMTKDQLIATSRSLDGAFITSGVYLHEQLIAASIAIRVSDEVLYNFYSAHAADFDALSPVVLLMDGLSAGARAQGFKWLDLGTSALDGKTNFELLDFKRRLGGHTSLKFTFEKGLN